MEERYWLRHSSVGHTGPHTMAVLRTAVGTNPALWGGEVSREGDDSATWQPVTALLGPARAVDPEEESAELGNHETLLLVRAGTAYEGVRLMVTILAVVGAIITVATTIIGLSALGTYNATTFTASLAVLGGAVLQILGILVVAGAVRALVDIADCALRRDRSV